MVCVLDIDFILVNGGRWWSSSSLIPVSEWAIHHGSTCSPPGDMSNWHMHHRIATYGTQSLIKCGGVVELDYCETYDKDDGSWVILPARMSQPKEWFGFVNLDQDRVWIGREKNIFFACDLLLNIFSWSKSTKSKALLPLACTWQLTSF